MSVESLAIALHHSRATGTAKLVLVGIANHDGDGGAWPAVRTLAKYAGIRDRLRIQRCIVKLEELGEIRRHVMEGGDHRTPEWERPNLYEFTLRCPHNCDGTRKHRVSDEIDLPAELPEEEHDPAVTRPPRGQETPTPAVTRPPKPSFNQLPTDDHASYVPDRARETSANRRDSRIRGDFGTCPISKTTAHSFDLDQPNGMCAHACGWTRLGDYWSPTTSEQLVNHMEEQ